MTYKRGAVAYDQAEPAGFDTRWRLPAAPAAPESGGWDAEALERCECGGAALCAGTGRLSNPPWAFCLGELILNNRFGGSALSVCALDVRVDDTVVAAQASWQLRGVVSNERYVTEEERVGLVARQAPLGRASASHAVLIPIRKSAKWWSLAQDQRRAIIEEDSRHIAIGMEYLPAVARRLHHCRDLPGEQPFDFLTWFEFAPDQESAFDELLHRLRSTHEWDYVDRELELRLVAAQGLR